MYAADGVELSLFGFDYTGQVGDIIGRRAQKRLQSCGVVKWNGALQAFIHAGHCGGPADPSMSTNYGGLCRATNPSIVRPGILVFHLRRSLANGTLADG